MRVDEARILQDREGRLLALVANEESAHRFFASHDMQDTIASALADPKVIMPNSVRAQFEYVLNLSKGVK